MHRPVRPPRLLPPLLAVVVAALVAAAAPPAPATASLPDPAQPPVADGPEHRSLPLSHADPPARELPGTEASDADPAAPPDQVRTATLSLDEGVHVVGLRWEGPAPGAAELRVRDRGGPWDDWVDLEDAVPTEPFRLEQEARTSDSAATGASGVPVDDADHVVRATTGDVVIGPAEVEVRLVGQADAATLETWTTHATASDADTVNGIPVSDDRLVVGTRADWGADETLPRVSRARDLVSPAPKLGVTVHHTAGHNAYAQTDVPAIIRGIHVYHGQTLRWDDIGYAALVDKYGRVWEGRAGGIEENVQLAHAFGMNRDWSGVAVLGNHETAQVWATELTALSRLTAWTLGTHGVTPGSTVTYTNASEGWTRTLDVVHAHRDVGQTLCPGWALYALMGQLRTMVAADVALDRDAVQRVGGGNRYTVAANLAQRAFLEGTRTAYLTSGTDLPDALGVGPVAHEEGAAVLLTRGDRLPQVTQDALGTLGVRDVVLVGGTDAIGEDVATRLVGLGMTVRRLEGTDRYATAAALATQRPRTGGTVYLAEGTVLADALGAAAAAAEQGGVSLLTKQDALPSASRAALTGLSPARVVVLGGQDAVGRAVLDEVAALLPGTVVDRVGGSNRYATSALLAADAFPSASSAVVAQASAPVDAMVGTQLAARHGAPVLLARQDCRPRSIEAAYRDLGISLSRLAGGPTVLAWGAGDTVCG